MDIDDLQTSGLLDIWKMFDIHALLASLVFGVIGYFLYRHGKRNSDRRNKIVGILLMIYPTFTSGPWQSWGIGILLCAYAFYWWD